MLRTLLRSQRATRKSPAVTANIDRHIARDLSITAIAESILALTNPAAPTPHWPEHLTHHNKPTPAAGDRFFDSDDPPYVFSFQLLDIELSLYADGYPTYDKGGRAELRLVLSSYPRRARLTAMPHDSIIRISVDASANYLSITTSLERYPLTSRTRLRQPFVRSWLSNLIPAGGLNQAVHEQIAALLINGHILPLAAFHRRYHRMTPVFDRIAARRRARQISEAPPIVPDIPASASSDPDAWDTDPTSTDAGASHRLDAIKALIKAERPFKAGTSLGASRLHKPALRPASPAAPTSRTSIQKSWPLEIYDLAKAQAEAGTDGDEIASYEWPFIEERPAANLARNVRLIRPVTGVQLAAVGALGPAAPHLADLTNAILERIGLSQASATPFFLSPLLLVGPPGVGKTWYLKRLAKALDLPLVQAPMTSVTLADTFSGANRSWKQATVGLVAKSLLGSLVCNPVFFVDELDKPATNSWNNDPYLLHTTATVRAAEQPDIFVPATAMAAAIVVEARCVGMKRDTTGLMFLMRNSKTVPAMLKKSTSKAPPNGARPCGGPLALTECMQFERPTDALRLAFPIASPHVSAPCRAEFWRLSVTSPANLDRIFLSCLVSQFFYSPRKKHINARCHHGHLARSALPPVRPTPDGTDARGRHRSDGFLRSLRRKLVSQGYCRSSSDRRTISHLAPRQRVGTSFSSRAAHDGHRGADRSRHRFARVFSGGDLRRSSRPEAPCGIRQVVWMAQKSQRNASRRLGRRSSRIRGRHLPRHRRQSLDPGQRAVGIDPQKRWRKRCALLYDTKCIHFGAADPMSVNLSIKNAPDDIVRRLRQRAERNHRSLQGELMAIIETAVADEDACTPIEILAQVRQIGLTTPREAVDMIRNDRDAR